MTPDLSTWLRVHAETATYLRRAVPKTEDILAIGIAFRPGQGDAIFGVDCRHKHEVGPLLAQVAAQLGARYIGVVVDAWMASVPKGEPVPSGPISKMPGRQSALVVLGRDLETGRSLMVSVRYFDHEGEWVFDEPMEASEMESHFLDHLP